MKNQLIIVVGLVIVVISSVAPLGTAIVSERAFFNIIGEEKASSSSHTEPQFNTSSIIHRQDVCDRSRRHQNGEVELKDALAGMQLHVLLVKNSILSSGSYTTTSYEEEETSLQHPEYPDIQAEILDELARRGNFTWRDSFGTVEGDATWSMSKWKQILLWGVETYDLNVGWWLEDIEDKKLGVSFLKGWYDASPIMIGKDVQNQRDNHNNVNAWNWVKPYNSDAWLLIIFTVFVSGKVYMILEWFADERGDRSLYDWWMENSYLSAINLTQQYEFQPKTFASRLFGLSMALWALIVNATFVANLAAHIVNQNPPPGPQTIDEAALLGYRIGIIPGSDTDIYLRNKFPESRLVYKKTAMGLYDCLNTDHCDYAVVTITEWEKHKGMKQYNPNCDLYWVGGDRKILEQSVGFTTKADSGHLCTGFIRDVLNIHMEEMIKAGYLRQAWAREYGLTRDIDCSTYKPGGGAPQSFLAPEDAAAFTTTDKTNAAAATDNLKAGGGSRTRHLRESYDRDHHHHHHPKRYLKAVAGATSGAVSALKNNVAQNFEQQTMSVKEMMGTFTLHWTLCVVSLVIASANALYVKYRKHFPLLPPPKEVEDPECFPPSNLEKSSRGSQSSLSSSACLVEERRDLQQQMAAMDEKQELQQQMAAMEQRMQLHLEQHLQLHEQKLLQQLEILFQTYQNTNPMPIIRPPQQSAIVTSAGFPDEITARQQEPQVRMIPSAEIETFSDEIIPDGRQIVGTQLEPQVGRIPSPVTVAGGDRAFEDERRYLVKPAAIMENQGSSTAGSQPRRRKQ